MYIRPLQMKNPHKWINRVCDICIKLKNRIKHIIKRIYSLFRKEVWLLESTDVTPLNNDTILYIGEAPGRHYICKLFFNNYSYRLIGYRWLWQVLFPKGIKFTNCSFSVIQTSWQIDKLFGLKKMFCVPAWVYGRVDLSSTFDNFMKNNKQVKKTLVKVKKGHFEVEISSDPLSFEEFYSKMYQPYISKRHGECTININYDRLKAQFNKHSEILFILKDSQRIAGQMIYYKSDMPQMYVLGIRDGDFKWVKQGAISALYFNTIVYLQSKGFKKLCLGGSRPFFTDSVLNYKLKNWNMKIEDYAKEFYFLIKQHSTNGFAQQFLSKNPFISIKNGEMVVNTFYLKNDAENDVINNKLIKYVQKESPKVAVHCFDIK